MKLRNLELAILAALALPVSAQETYQDAKLMETDLNGTARYVGMGGAMEALGADISTMSTNPAGIGLFRKGMINITGGLVTQGNASTSLSNADISSFSFNGKKTNASFDQIGFVWANRTSDRSYINFGVNYHKSQNFDQILSTLGTLDNASQNKLSALKYSFLTDYNTTSLDNAYAKLLGGGKYYNGSAFGFGQYQKGYIGNYDFNISGNVSDRFYWGVTVGYHDVHYRSNVYYTENLEQNNYADTYEDMKITGSGVDFKVGAIFRPIESSPFRIGLYINSPTFYDLTLNATSAVRITSPSSKDPQYYEDRVNYDYKVNSPWKFGLSLGHTIGNYLALGATYEYADYGYIDNRINDGGYYDGWYGDYYETSSSDKAMNDNTKFCLKGVSTVKLGVEIKPVPQFAIRLGYNYVSPMYSKDGYRDGSIESPGTMVSTSTYYTNWHAINRFTCGLGYQIKKITIDLAYQYSAQNGDFYPFMSYTHQKGEDASYDNIADAAKVSNKRHQLQLTLGYKF